MSLLKEKKCLVTGGAGFIGSHLVDLLMSLGCTVRVLDNLANGKIENLAHHLPDSRFNFYKGSVTDPFDVDNALEGMEVVFHLACLGVRHSIPHPFENHRVNAEGTLLVLHAAGRHRVERFLYCSSSEVYGTAEFVPMPEHHPTRPCTVYGAGKLAGEAYARAYYRTYGMKTVIVRPFNAYGPRSHHEGDAGEMIPKSIVRALNKKPIIVFGDGSQTRDFTFVEDIADGLVLAIESDDAIGQTLNLGSNHEISIKDIALKLLMLTGDSESSVEYQADRPGDVLRLFADSTRFCSLTGWKPRIGLEQGLKRTIDYFRRHMSGVSRLAAEEKGRNWEV